MSYNQRFCVVFLPSPQEHRWRAAFRSAATLAGWKAVEGHDPLVQASDGEHNLLIEMSDGSQVDACRPTSTTIVADKPQAAITTLIEDFKIPYIDAVRAAARFFAMTVPVIQRGACVFDAQAVSIATSELGTVVRDAGPSQAMTQPLTGPLDFYETLPPPVGAKALWPSGLFDWNGLDPWQVDMTGGCRVLQYGPFIELCVGVWRVDLSFTLRLESGRAELRFEWGTGGDCVSHSELLSQSGVYSLSLERAWPAPAVSEVRIWLDRAMFDGTLEVMECSVIRTG